MHWSHFAAFSHIYIYIIIVLILYIYIYIYIYNSVCLFLMQPVCMKLFVVVWIMYFS